LGKSPARGPTHGDLVYGRFAKETTETPHLTRQFMEEGTMNIPGQLIFWALVVVAVVIYVCIYHYSFTLLGKPPF
jgi:hypothetical protein